MHSEHLAMTGLRVLVCGGRDYQDRTTVYRELDKLHLFHGIAAIITGAADGADSIADDWARKYGVQNHRFPAEWNRYGAAAGPIRNKRMLDEAYPDLIVAFPGGRGTANLMEQARRRGVRVLEPAC